MNISRLDHVNIRTNQLDAMVEWYEKVLGFARGPRPDFGFDGAWMYRHGQPLVHLVAIPDEIPAQGDLTLEHAAFSSSGLAEFKAHLTALNVTFKQAIIEEFGIVQMNVWDPDGNHLHIDFSTSELA